MIFVNNNKNKEESKLIIVGVHKRTLFVFDL